MQDEKIFVVHVRTFGVPADICTFHSAAFGQNSVVACVFLI